MKDFKIFSLLIFSTLIWQKNRAQEPVQGSYITNTTMTPFHGNWQWVSGADTVQLYLTTKKVYCDFNGGFYWDLLVGWHIYKQGRTVVESSLQYIGNINLSTFLGSNSTDLPAKIESATFKDITKNKEVELFLTLNPAQNQLTWRLAPSQGMRVGGSGDFIPPPGFTLPRNLILIKL
jgi:hypothetical protein